MKAKASIDGCQEERSSKTKATWKVEGRKCDIIRKNGRSIAGHTFRYIFG